MARRTQVHRVPVVQAVVPEPKARLRCWQDRRGDLHLAGDEAGAAALADAVAKLKDCPAVTVVTLPLVDSPIPPGKHPLPSLGTLKLFRELLIRRIDDAEVVHYMFAHASDRLAEILLGPGLIEQFWSSCEDMRKGGGDFSIGLETVGIMRNRRKRLKTLDKGTARVHFWGYANLHGVYSF